MDPLTLQMITVIFALFFGAICFVLAKHLQIPAIVPLLIGGVLLGPEVLGIVNTASLGDGLKIIISICVAIILFEGGLTLNRTGYQKASKVIWRLLTIGVIITWLGTTALVILVFGYSFPLALLAGSLIIVTGPTVIAPLLKRIKVKEELHQILHWEGVLIDPIGVFIAVLCFEWMSANGTFISNFNLFALRVGTGLVVGIAGGLAIQGALGRKWVPEAQTNTFVLASAIALFGLSDLIMHEAGILTVVIAGLVIGWKRTTPQLKSLITFKSELTEIAIGFLFILLAANLELANFVKLGWKGLIMLGGVLLLVRPLSIFASAVGTDMPVKDRMFLSWIAPRGIIAGSMASLFALQLKSAGQEEAAFLEAFTFSVIASTILVQGLSGNFVAKLLRVNAKEKRGWLIVGAHLFARRISSFIAKVTQSPVLLIDTDLDTIAEAQSEGFKVVNGSALTVEELPPEFTATIGNVLALTDNKALNQLVCDRWSEHIPAANLFRWTAPSIGDSLPEGKGTIVWDMLKKPSTVSLDLRHHDSMLQFHADSEQLLPENNESIPLIAFSENKIFFPPHIVPTVEINSILYLKQRDVHLARVVNTNTILDLDAKAFSDIVHSSLEAARKNTPDLPYETLRNDLLKQEQVLPTVLGNSVAVPHCRCATMERPVCILVRNKTGFDMDAPDGQPTSIFFVLISALSDPGTHLILLSEVARLASDPEWVERLRLAGDTNIVIELLREIEED
ncbi:MAG: cation:proton antiporter [Calditrichia bacterium]